MKSVVVIAHNEGNNISRCIKSLLAQTVQGDEIIVVAHNCTDATIYKAKEFSDPRIIIDDYQGPSGIIHARIRGINQATGDEIFCIDGDAFASRNWIETLDNKISDSQVSLAGSAVQFFGTFFWAIASPFNRLFGTIGNDKAGFIWGPSFAFRAEYKNQVIKFLQESELVAQELKLNRNPDDYWLALNMQTLGKLVYTTKTKVFAQSKQLTSRECLERNKSDVSNGKKLLEYFKKNKKSL